jgi:hypothetical protein
MADAGGDIRPDSRADVRWLSYDEASQALHIDRESVARRARRARWPRRTGNDGTVRVGVPADILADAQPDTPDALAKTTSKVPDLRPDIRSDLSGMLAAMLMETQGRAGRLEAALQEARDQAAQASAEHARALAEARERAAHTEGIAQAQRDSLAAVTQERDQLRAEVDALRARGLLDFLRGIWRSAVK